MVVQTNMRQCPKERDIDVENIRAATTNVYRLNFLDMFFSKDGHSLQRLCAHIIFRLFIQANLRQIWTSDIKAVFAGGL